MRWRCRARPRKSSPASGTSSSAAADGVGARRSAAKSAIVKSISWPIALTTGIALARIARELRPNLPVVYASGSYSKIEELDAVSGAILVPKPYNPDKLCEMLSEMTVAAH